MHIVLDRTRRVATVLTAHIVGAHTRSCLCEPLPDSISWFIYSFRLLCFTAAVAAAVHIFVHEKLLIFSGPYIETFMVHTIYIGIFCIIVISNSCARKIHHYFILCISSRSIFRKFFFCFFLFSFSFPHFPSLSASLLWMLSLLLFFCFVCFFFFSKFMNSAFHNNNIIIQM